MKDIKALSKIAVKLDSEYEQAHGKHHKKKARILKRAIMIEKKLTKAVHKVMPLATMKEVKATRNHQLAWMKERMDNRTGRIIQRRVT